MDVLAIILACSLHPDDALVRALVDVQSGGNQYFVGDLGTLRTNDSLKSAEAALRFAEDLRGRGGRPAIGLLGVPLDWAGRYGRAPIDLFDACTNVAIATAAFSEYHDRCSPGAARRHDHYAPHRRRRARRVARNLRYCILSRFAADLGLRGAPAALLRLLSDEGVARPARSEYAAPMHSPIFGGALGILSPELTGPRDAEVFLGGTAKAPVAR